MSKQLGPRLYVPPDATAECEASGGRGEVEDALNALICRMGLHRAMHLLQVSATLGYDAAARRLLQA